jgi:hypothetical protein
MFVLLSHATLLVGLTMIVLHLDFEPKPILEEKRQFSDVDIQ